jgi:hypothetical protein
MHTHLPDLHDDLRALAQEVMDREGRADTPFGTYVLPSSDPGAELGRAVEREVFLQYFGNSPKMLADEYELFEPSSVFVTVVDHRRRVPAAVMRVLLPGVAGSKSLQDVARYWTRPADEVPVAEQLAASADDVWDLATLAVSEPYRGGASAGLVGMAIFQAIGMLATRHDIRWLVAIIDLVALDIVQPPLHHIWMPLPGHEPRSYLDSAASVPIYTDLPAYRARLAREDPTLYELLFEGTGMEAAVSTPAWELGIDELGGRRLAAIA